MSQQVINNLIDSGWEFRNGFAFPATEFKSPRLKNFYLYPGEEFTETQIRNYEIDSVINERSNDFNKLCDDALKEYISQLRIILRKNGPVPNEVSIDLKFKE